MARMMWGFGDSILFGVQKGYPYFGKYPCAAKMVLDFIEAANELGGDRDDKSMP